MQVLRSGVERWSDGVSDGRHRDVTLGNVRGGKVSHRVWALVYRLGEECS